ncbi:MAG TPA: TOBE domain-containing protein, partial [Blastocatellia bacterium]|nr:TOBE domain-containing protein [Blastocatellia bacterium]
NPETRFIADFVGVTNVLEGIVMSGGNGHTLVEAAGGRVSIAERLVPGQRVSLAVRPEKIRFVGAGEDGAIAGTVEDALYLGDVTHWRVRLDDGVEWTIFERNDGTEVDLSPGRRVGLVWDPEHTIRLER